jgi:hypothetical protein
VLQRLAGEARARGCTQGARIGGDDPVKVGQGGGEFGPGHSGEASEELGLDVGRVADDQRVRQCVERGGLDGMGGPGEDLQALPIPHARGEAVEPGEIGGIGVVARQIP